MDAVIAIPSKHRHPALTSTLSRLPGAWRTLVCDQSAQPLAGTHASCAVLHRPNLNGLPAARNALLQAVAAEWVVFIDDDCDLAHDFLARLAEVVAADPRVAAWGPVCETRGRWLRRLHRLAHLGVFADPRRLCARRVDAPTRALFGCCFAIRRDTALAVGGFDGSRPGYALGEDYEFFLRLQAAGERARFARRLRAVHRREGENRADPDRRGADKVAFLVWIARRHGGRNPVTLLHLLWAIAAALCGRGDEPASWRGGWRGLRAWLG